MKLSEIYQTLYQVRKERGLSQVEVAAALAVEQATVSMYENGKRGIPLDILDRWLELLEIEVKIIPKGFEPVKREEETQSDLDAFNQLKKRRNYLVAELRAGMAEHVMNVPEFQRAEDESGENLFWPYSLDGESVIGLVETRYDHPQQKHLAVEYTQDEVNVYKFLTSGEVSDGQSDMDWLNVNRIYFSEDDFLTFGGIWDQESMDMRKVTLLRKNENSPDGVEVVAAEGFSVRSLLDMQENYMKFARVAGEAMMLAEYKEMNRELEDIENKILDLVLDNRFGNGTMNPDFALWTQEDKDAVDVPLWDMKRNWHWLDEGAEWVEEFQEAKEVQVMNDDDVFREHLYVHRHTNGNRVIGLIGPEQKPAVFMGGANKPNVIYRLAVEPEELNEEELADYQTVLASTKELEEIRTMSSETSEED